jgi:aryl-alcohol dehydrogenase-like predicted oxidoreductase
LHDIPLVLGTVQLGVSYGVANKTGCPDQSSAISIVREAWENGIREFDTAQGYGKSERVLGQALEVLGFAHEARIVTKFDPNLDHLDDRIMASALDKSLGNLGQSSLYAMMLHREDLLSIWDCGLSDVLGGFVARGKIEKVGFSVYSPDKALEALNTDGVDIVQLPTNVLDRRFETAGVFQLAMEKQKIVYIRSVFLQGLILMEEEEIPERMAFAKPFIRRFESLSKELGFTRRELALGYIKHGFPGTKLVFGAELSGQVRANCSSWEKEIPASLVPLIRENFTDVDHRVLNPSLWSK